MKPGVGLELVSLDGKLSTPDGQWSLSARVRIGTIIPQGYEGFRNQVQNLEFPLDAARIAALERLRDGGGLNLRLNAALTVKKLRALNKPPPDQPLADVVWGFIYRSQLQLNTGLAIPRDVWIAQVLPNVGHGVVHVVEFPAAPVESCASLEHAFKALRLAQERHKEGLYDDAVGKCRIALEKFFDYEARTGADGKTRDFPIPKKTWETRVGEATYKWLEAMFRSIKGAANPTAHSADGHFSQFDSQMALAITTAVVAYIARTIGTEAESRLKDPSP
jgi:hypothetical protein